MGGAKEMKTLEGIFYFSIRWMMVLCILAVLPFTGAELRADDFDVVINELNYNVFDNGGEDSLEFIELFNRGGTTLELGGWEFSRGVDFVFPAGTLIETGEYLVLSPDPALAAAR